MNERDYTKYVLVWDCAFGKFYKLSEVAFGCGGPLAESEVVIVLWGIKILIDCSVRNYEH